MSLLLKWKRLNTMQKLEKIRDVDKKIPPIDFDLYYPL